MKGVAIISVYDKTSLEPFARELSQLGYTILSTGGTAKFLEQHGIPLTPISKYTGSPEILDGRVKSLHPKIHGGILARKDKDEDLAQLREHGIQPVDFVVVNLYPFVHKVRELEQQGKVDHESLVELIDIGGPTMIRAAAKNCAFVVPVSDPADYPRIMSEIKERGTVTIETRRELAAKVFAMVAAYDGEIARYFSLGERLLDEKGRRVPLAPIESVTLQRAAELRYGENPHQSAALYRPYAFTADDSREWWHQLQGKEISYNNLLDMHAALDLFLELVDGIGDRHAAVVIKHSNPCGAAVRSTPLEAFKAARDCDPLSAFGGIVAVSGTIDASLAESITEGFVEVVLAQRVSEDGRSVFGKKKNIRVIECDVSRYLDARRSGTVSVRNSFGDYLVQTADTTITLPSAGSVAAGEAPSRAMSEDLTFAWKVCKHVKSNAIVISKGLQAVGVGAGQMSRVDAAKLAVQRARFHNHDISGAVAASDAFLPFPDTLEILNDAGVAALVQPGGSIKDEDVTAAAKARGMTMVLTNERHFRH